MRDNDDVDNDDDDDAKIDRVLGLIVLRHNATCWLQRQVLFVTAAE